MKTKMTISTVAICFLLSATTYAQVTALGNDNIGPLPKYVGWSGINLGGAVAGPLNIRNGNLGMPINFFNGGFPGFQRMTIFDGGIGVANGNIAMGNNLPLGFNPAARLHLHETGGGLLNNPNLRFTTTTTGPLATDGFEIGIINNGFAYLSAYEMNVGIAFNTENTTSGTTPFQRMLINPESGNGFIGMGASATFNALAQLHINTIGVIGGTPGVYGNLFRTEGPTTLPNVWSMWSGNNPLLPMVTNEIFNLTSPANTSDLRIETVQNGSTMFFTNGPGIDVMQVNSIGGPGFGLGNGNVWIRKNIVHPFYNPAFLDMGGPIAFSMPNTPAGTNTLIYHNTSPIGATNDPIIGDGVRMLYDFNSEGINNADCFVIEKTDGGSPIPDGCIKFTNHGSDAIQRLSMTIEGNGNVGCEQIIQIPLFPLGGLA